MCRIDCSTSLLMTAVVSLLSSTRTVFSQLVKLFLKVKDFTRHFYERGKTSRTFLIMHLSLCTFLLAVGPCHVILYQKLCELSASEFNNSGLCILIDRKWHLHLLLVGCKLHSCVDFESCSAGRNFSVIIQPILTGWQFVRELFKCKALFKSVLLIIRHFCSLTPKFESKCAHRHWHIIT